MLELTMAAAHRHDIPAVFFQQFVGLHSPSCTNGNVGAHFLNSLMLCESPDIGNATSSRVSGLRDIYGPERARSVEGHPVSQRMSAVGRGMSAVSRFMLHGMRNLCFGARDLRYSGRS